MKTLTDSQRKNITDAWRIETKNPKKSRWVEGSNTDGRPERQVPWCKRSKSRNSEAEVVQSQGVWKFRINGECRTIITIDQFCEFFFRQYEKLSRKKLLEEIPKKYVGISRSNMGFLLKVTDRTLRETDSVPKSSNLNAAKRPNYRKISSRPIRSRNGGLPLREFSVACQQLTSGLVSPGFSEACQQLSSVSVSPRFSQALDGPSQGPGSPGFFIEAWGGRSQGPGSPGPLSEAWEGRSQGPESPGFFIEAWGGRSQGPGSPGFSKASQQQESLFNDARRYRLEENWKEHKKADPDSYVAFLAGISLHTFKKGRAARPAVGRSGWSDKDADYLLLTEEEYTDWLSTNPSPRVVVIRDPAQRKAIASSREFLSDPAVPEGTLVDVQSFNRATGKTYTNSIPWLEVKEKWFDNSEGFRKDPINLLNLRDYSMNLVPAAFSALPSCGFLKKVCNHEDNKIWSNTKGLQRSQIARYGPGKKHVERIFAKADLRNSQCFRIMAKSGCVSGWHMDYCGLITYVMVAGNRTEGEQDEDVVKYWPFIPMDKLDGQEKASSLQEFIDHGMLWEPNPTGGIPVLALIKGDTIVMPPGTIHAPITLTDVSMAGGMCMDDRLLMEHLKWWCFYAENNHCSNEMPPKETRSIIDIISKYVHSNPESYGFGTTKELEDFEKLYKNICSFSHKCNCSKGCGKNCPCAKWDIQCGRSCHPKASACRNSEN